MKRFVGHFVTDGVPSATITLAWRCIPADVGAVLPIGLCTTTLVNKCIHVK